MTPSSQRKATQQTTGFFSNLLTWLGGLVALFALGFGFYLRDYHYYTAESGLGYWLGIVGGSMMLLLLTYSLRKRVKSLSKVVKLKHWFRLHMVLGVVGPILILYHGNFSLGSFNSTVALVSMLLVAGSGLIGRYLYSHLHYNLYGNKIRLGHLRKEILELLETLNLEFLPVEQQNQRHAIETCVIDLLTEQTTGKGSSRSKNRKTAQSNVRAINQYLNTIEVALANNASADPSAQATHLRLKNQFHSLIKTLKKVPNLQRFEQLFSLWHVVHIPVFILMIITAVTHIVVVHQY